MSQALNFVPRDGTAAAVVQCFRNRMVERNKAHNPTDKRNNNLLTLPGTPGSGKSSFMAEFPFSAQFKQYAKARQQDEGLDHTPLVALFTFNSGMGYPHDVAIGLRIIYGVLRWTGSTEMWKDFYDRHAHSKDLNAADAVAVLRQAFGDNRLILIGVDELSKTGESSKDIMQQLCVVLDNDGRTDVLVSTLSPAYIRELLNGTQRDIDYVPIPPLSSNALEEEFRDVSEALVQRVKQELEACGFPALDPVNERILRNIHILASGHPRTAEHLKESIERGYVNGKVKKTLLERCYPIQPYVLLHGLLKLHMLSKLSSPPENDAQRELILSVGATDVTEDATARVMIDDALCFLFDQQDSADTSATATTQNHTHTHTHFRLSTTLSSFFELLHHLYLHPPSASQPLSCAMLKLFLPCKGKPFQIPEVWERAHCFTVVSRAHYLLRKDRSAAGNGVFSLSRVCGLHNSAFYCCDVVLRGDLNVKVANENKEMVWEQDTLYVAPSGQAGFDYSLCVRNRQGEQVHVYVEIQSAPRVSAITSAAPATPTADSAEDLTAIAKLFARKLRWTLREHLERVEPTSTTSSQEDQLAALQHVYFVLSRFGSEVSNMAALKVEVETQLKDEIKKDEVQGKTDCTAEWSMTLAFVERYWERNVAFQGTDEMTASMVPAVLPIAHLVQAVGENDEEDK